jgi:hypothetical protein
MLRGMSKNAQCFRFNCGSKHGMQACPRHDVGLGAEDVADAILNIDQLDQTEARVVRIEEKVGIAVRLGVASPDGTEEIQACDPSLMKSGFMSAQLAITSSRSMSISGSADVRTSWAH